MRKRRGASLLNVMVFMMFAVMITAQVFFFSKSSSDSLAEGREIMLYRLQLDSLVEEAKDALRVKEGDKVIGHLPPPDAEPDAELPVLDTKPLKYSDFSDDAKIFDDSDVGSEWRDNGYHVRIYDLDYMFDSGGENSNSFNTNDRNKWTENYSGSYKHRKLFAAMPPIGIISTDASGNIQRNDIGKPIYKTVDSRYYLIRAWKQLPENYYGTKLMYQVLVERDEKDPSSGTYHNVDVLSFQEVWY